MVLSSTLKRRGRPTKGLDFTAEPADQYVDGDDAYMYYNNSAKLHCCCSVPGPALMCSESVQRGVQLSGCKEAILSRQQRKLKTKKTKEELWQVLIVTRFERKQMQVGRFFERKRCTLERIEK